jgi:preprotein translocase subunit SecF
MTIAEIFNNESTINFTKSWRVTLPLSLLISVASAILILVAGFNLSIDFEGGGIYEVKVPESVTVSQARDALTQKDVRIQIVKDASGASSVRVQTGPANLADSDQIVTELATLSGLTKDDVSINEVGPTWGDQITKKAVRAVIFFFAAVAIYLSLTLEWQMAAGAVFAVIHDLLLTAGVYAILRFEVSPATVIALLTIMGYSLYDTVVVYDKVRENDAENVGKRAVPYAELVNQSMNQVLMRSINTTLTTVLPVVSMLVIGGIFLGGGTLRDFALALFIGLLAGTYSSIFVASPLLVWLKDRGSALSRGRSESAKASESKTSKRTPSSAKRSGPSGLPR